LKAKNRWKDSRGEETDDYGFSAFPGNARVYGYFTFPDGYKGYWWTATEFGGDSAYVLAMAYHDDSVAGIGTDKSKCFSVRCVRKRPWYTRKKPMPIFDSRDTLPAIPYDTLTDTRDGKKYKTVTIGGQTWTAENMNYMTPDSSWCYYKNNVNNCAKYGRLYAWNAANKACPNGYHLPSREEWNRLVLLSGGWRLAGKKLQYDYNFLALLGGKREYRNVFSGIGNGGYWWTADEAGCRQCAYFRNMYYNYDGVNADDDNKRNAFSVRCVADSP
jgi:uncharacterized protein (TIGR02145 family)